jgi:hypothetical protein
MTSRWKRCRQVQWISSQSAAKRRDEGAPAEFNSAWRSRALNDRAAHLASEVAAATRELEEEIILRLALAVEFRGSCGSPATAGSSPGRSIASAASKIARR